MSNISIINYFIVFLTLSLNINADSFRYNFYNNHGVVGVINTPSARFYEESSYGISFYEGEPDQKITFTSSPYDWFEASFFYMNIEDKQLCRQYFEIQTFCQGYKDKGFNFKLRLKEEGKWPALAIGFNDVAGTGFYSSEYIVGSYGVGATDFNFGIGWGNLNGSSHDFKNPFGIIFQEFFDRPTDLEGRGGQFQFSRYFSGKTASPFLGVSQIINEKLSLRLEYDPTKTPGKVGFEIPASDISFGLKFKVSKDFTIGLSSERGNYTSFNFTYKNNPQANKIRKNYKKSKYLKSDDKYQKFVKNMKRNGIGVNKIIEKETQIGVELTQHKYTNLESIEEIIMQSSQDAGIEKEVKKDLRIASLKAFTELGDGFEEDSKIIYERKQNMNFSQNTSLSIRPFIASREEFFKGAVLVENDNELVISDNFFFSSNLKYSILDNFDDLILPPVDTYPAQVRSDVKDYLRNFGDGIFIGRAQFDYHLSPRTNHYFMATVGILEEMFSGAGVEYLYFKQDSNFALGFEIFEVAKRDYRMRFDTLDYRNTTGFLNFYYRNYDLIPFDSKISYGEYLAGDKGLTFEISRSFRNGMEFGIFASFTDVDEEQFGEGSFDKGVFFNIPVFGELVSYSWRPLTKDPGAKLIRKHTLHDLLIKFRPIN
tara:strand:+ start:320 stop:2281 length:1962 start_codon:yes stop_codon:yes gene_type:complete